MGRPLAALQRDTSLPARKRLHRAVGGAITGVVGTGATVVAVAAVVSGVRAMVVAGAKGTVVVRVVTGAGPRRQLPVPGCRSGILILRNQ